MSYLLTRLLVVASLALFVTATPAGAKTREYPGGCRTHACLARTCLTWKCKQRILPAETKRMLARLRGCETRGISYPRNYRWDGHHDGAYQYDEATWHQAGGHGVAFKASPAEQDVRTARFFPSHRGQWQCKV